MKTATAANYCDAVTFCIHGAVCNADCSLRCGGLITESLGAGVTTNDRTSTGAGSAGNVLTIADADPNNVDGPLSLNIGGGIDNIGGTPTASRGAATLSSSTFCWHRMRSMYLCL